MQQRRVNEHWTRLLGANYHLWTAPITGLQHTPELFRFITGIRMVFEKFETDVQLQALNTYLADKSYVEGVEASQADAAIYEATKQQIDAAKYPHVARWLSHIASFASALDKLPGTKKPVAAYLPNELPKKADEDIDLFGSDEEDEEAEKAKAQRLAEYQAKKAKKPAVVAKSTVVMDVKPWESETDMAEMERQVRQLSMDGLLWGASKLVPIGYGIRKLQISCVVEDDKVGLDNLEEAITGLEDLVQSVDVVSFNKI